MKKILFVLLACSILLCGCKSNTQKQDAKWGAEYSVANKYKVLLPDNISPTFSYDEVIELNGFSQYGSKSKDTFPSWFEYSSNAYYNTTLLDKECIIGYSFYNDKIDEIAYIFECSDKEQFESLTEELYDKLVECFGESNVPPQETNYCVTWNTYLDDYMVDLLPSKSQNSIFVILSLNETLTGNGSNDTYYTTTTTAYEWKLNTNSTGKDWNSVNDTEKEVWCSNSITAWKVMGYDIPSDVSIDNMKKYMDSFYSDGKNNSVDIVTVSEAYAILKGVY